MRTVTQLTIAVAGTGNMGTGHLGTIASIADYRLVAVCDADAARAEAAATPRGVPWFSDLGELLRHEVPDVLVVATPPGQHFEMAAQALAAGCHVYCEKPLTPTCGQGYDLARLAADAGRIIQVGFQNRLQPAYQRAHELVASGAIGAIYRADLYSTNWFRSRAYYTEAPWRGTWAGSAGGVLMSQSIHQLDEFIWIAGMPSRLTAAAWHSGHDMEVEDDVMAMLEFPGGGRGMLVTSTIDHVGTDRMMFQGDEGTLVIEGNSIRIGRTETGRNRLNDTGPPFAGTKVDWEEVELPVVSDSLVALCHLDLLDAIRRQRSPLNHAAEASRAIEVCNAVYLSAITGRPVDLPIDRQAYDALYADLVAGRAGLAASPGAQIVVAV